MTKKERAERNSEIYKNFNKGNTVEKLSFKYKLTESTIKSIIRDVRGIVYREKIRKKFELELQEKKKIEEQEIEDSKKEMKAIYEELKKDPEMQGYIS